MINKKIKTGVCSKCKRKSKPSNLKKVGLAGLTVGKWLLEFLSVMIDLMPGIETPYAHTRRLSGWPQEIPRNRIYAEVKRMKDRGWIIEAEKQGKKFIKLTKKGRLEVLYRKLKSLPPATGRRLNGSWWLAMFDIPEQGRIERDAIRKALVVAGFFRLQKSVYVYPDEIPTGLIAYLREAKLLSYIRFIHADRIDDIKNIEENFRVQKTRV